jgi:hypothetical protein
VEIARQLVRSSDSVGANDIEAKESRYRLQLLESAPDVKNSQAHLIQETTELMKIFGAILEEIKQRQQPNGYSVFVILGLRY